MVFRRFILGTLHYYDLEIGIPVLEEAPCAYNLLNEFDKINEIRLKTPASPPP